MSSNDAHFSFPSRILVSSKGFLVTAGDDGTVRIWDAATTAQLLAIRCKQFGACHRPIGRR